MTVYDIDGNLCSETDYVLEKWNQEFEKLYSRSETEANLNDDYKEMLSNKQAMELNLQGNDYLNEEITFDEVENVIKNARKKKACGYDQICIDILDNIECKQILLKLFTVCFAYGKVPECWLKAIISPIPKSSLKDPYIPTSYRGVSLLSQVGKLYSQIINKRVLKYCEEAGIFCDEQNGFRKSRSCEDHIFSLTSIIRNRLYANKDTFVAFIDMQKAFDWVNRDLLWYKLLIHNISGNIYWAIRSLYNNTISCVRLNNLYSKWFDVTTGVRQGDNLSPTLFGIFINDLAIEIQNLGLGVTIGEHKVSILLYADDIAILSENEENLQKMLDKLNEWCQKWQLSINSQKSQTVHSRRKRKTPSAFQFHIGTTSITTVEKYKYLGVTLDQHIEYKICGQELAEAGGRALGGLIAKFKTYKNIGYDTFTKLYQMGVMPIIDYCSGIWGASNSKFAEKIQNRAYRYFLGVHAKTPIHVLTGDMGWMPVKSRMRLNILKYYNRLIKMDHNRLTYKLFENDIQNISNENWSSDLANILEEIGMTNSLITGQEINLDSAKEKLLCVDDLEWQESIANKPKLRTYVKFKCHINTEDYVTLNLNRKERSLLTKLRSGTLPLAIEKGRYRNQALEQRVCILCHQNEIEDEIHFVINCPYYSTHREKFFLYIANHVSADLNLPPQEKFLFLMKLSSKDLRCLAKYLVSIWDSRNSYLYQS